MLKINKHKILCRKIHNNQKILLMADIHLWEFYNNKVLNKIILESKKLKPNIICICGDIIDEFRFLNKEENGQKLLAFLNELSDIALVIITLGSHDFFNLKKEQTNNKSSLSIAYWHKLIEKNNNSKLILLDNDIYETPNIRIIGYTPSRDYFMSGENKEILINELNDKIPKFKNNHKYTILMCHTPLEIKKETLEKINFISDIDLILSGHMHDGLVFPILKYLPTTRGLVSPQKSFFPINARGKKSFSINNHKITLIINGGIIKFSHSAPNFLQKLNFLYNSDIDFIEINKY